MPTPLERLMALADEKANTSQQEVLALVIDRETSNEVSRINREIGESVYRREVRYRWGRFSAHARLQKDWEAVTNEEQAAIALGKDPSYERLLNEYVSLKMYLHDLRRSCYYRGDPYSEREDIDVNGILDRCDELKQMIKAKRKSINFAAWGGMEPTKVTAYDKPVLYAFDEYTCSHITFDGEDTTETCPLKGEHWYQGKPYCRTHLGEARREFKLAKRRKRWACKVDECDRVQPHFHGVDSVHYYGAQMPVKIR